MCNLFFCIGIFSFRVFFSCKSCFPFSSLFLRSTWDLRADNLSILCAVVHHFVDVRRLSRPRLILLAEIMFLLSERLLCTLALPYSKLATTLTLIASLVKSFSNENKLFNAWKLVDNLSCLANTIITKVEIKIGWRKVIKFEIILEKKQQYDFNFEIVQKKTIKREFVCLIMNFGIRFRSWPDYFWLPLYMYTCTV